MERAAAALEAACANLSPAAHLDALLADLLHAIAVVQTGLQQLGDTARARPAPPDAATLRQHLRHEWVHIRQFMRWGALFPLLYFLELLRHLSCGKDPYLHNRFECEARREEH